MIFPLGICAVRSSNANHPSSQRQITNLKQGAAQGASRMRRPLLANSHWHWGTMSIRYRKTTYGVRDSTVLSRDSTVLSRDSTVLSRDRGGRLGSKGSRVGAPRQVQTGSRAATGGTCARAT